MDKPDENQIKKAFLKLRQLKKDNPLLSFEPYVDKDGYSAQLEFLKSTKRRQAAISGNRGGKTTVGTVKALMYATGWYPDWFPNEMKFELPIKGRIIISDYKEHGRVLQGKIKEWCPKGMIKRYVKNPQGSVVGVEFNNGSYISILTREQSTEQHEGWDGHFVWIDEPCPEDKFNASARGLIDHNGVAFFTLSPLSEPWLSDRIYEEEPDLWDTFHLNPYDNPYVDNLALDNFFNSLSETEKQARKEGKFIHLAGSVYPNFRRHVHVIKDTKIPDGWPRYMVIDPRRS